MIGQILLLSLFVGLSAFFSGSETALVLSNKLKMEIKARKNNFAARYTMYFTHNQDKFFSTILIGNNIANIGFASIFSLMFKDQMQEWQIVLVSTILLLLLGELFPKYLSREYPDMMIMITVIPLMWLGWLLTPITKVISFIPKLISGANNVDKEAFQSYFDREDLKDLVKESEEAGSVSKKESEIIGKVLQLRDQKVNQAMRPRTEITGVDIESTVDEVLDVFIESGFSKLPVYAENFDNIKGIIIAYDFFKRPDTIQQLIRNVLVVPEARRSIDVLNDFLSQKISFAVVVDEYGGTAGIVTMEDIMEELFGEIKDEYDVEEDICRKISDSTYIMTGKTEIDFLNEQYNLNIADGDYETISGFITSHIGRIPTQSEDLKINGFQIHIIRATVVKIELLKLTVVTDF